MELMAEPLNEQADVTDRLLDMADCCRAAIRLLLSRDFETQREWEDARTAFFKRPAVHALLTPEQVKRATEDEVRVAAFRDYLARERAQ